jgi:outer membrane protein TolC
MDAIPRPRRSFAGALCCHLMWLCLVAPRDAAGQAPSPVKASLGPPIVLETPNAPTQGTPAVSGADRPLPPSPQGSPLERLPAPSPLPGAGSAPPWSAPNLKPGEEALPISLPAALKLANVRAWDIAIAEHQLQIATAQLQGAKVLWIPSAIGGVYYAHHEGPIQANDGSVTDSTRSSLTVSMAPLLNVYVSDAIFTPLAQRQVRRAQEANVQTATNDTLTGVALVYFDAQEARAGLASILEVKRLVADTVTKTEKLVPGLVPSVELARVRALQANVLQAEQLAWMRWRLASAEVARVLRLNPAIVVQPLEPPHLRVTLIPPTCPLEEMIPVARRLRPEVTAYEAQVAAAEERLRQEKYRPFLPIILLRGGSTPTPYPEAFGLFAAGQGSNLSTTGLRSDWDLEAVWEFKNLGFGNLALVRERQANLRVAQAQQYRFQDIVAKEVTEAWVLVQAADQRATFSEKELEQAWISATKNLEALGQFKQPAGNIVQLVIRPQEVTAAMQALVQAYYNYFGSVADYNRAQFRLYRALGNPAQYLHAEADKGTCKTP